MTGQTSSNGPGALSHLRVVETGDMPAAYCARLLGDLGADVVKVEPPGGDPNRWLPPFAGDVSGLERSLTFINANVNKRSIVLDLRSSAEDRAVFARLLETADILVEATSVGTLEEWGLSQDALLARNPRLVTVSMTPFGQTGPYHSYKGGEAVIQAMCGLSYMQGDNTKPPCLPPCHHGYQMAAAQAAFLGVAAARHARRTGAGQRIDLSLQEAVTYAAQGAVSRYSQRSEVPTRPGGAPRGGTGNTYRCADGRYVNVNLVYASQWHALAAEWMEDPIISQPEWLDSQFRAANADVSDAIIAEFIGRFTADEFTAEAQRRKIPTAPVNTIPEFLESAQIRERAWVQDAEHPVIGRYRAPGPPFRLSDSPVQFRRPAPLLGQHQQEVLAELGARPQQWSNGPASSAGAEAPMLDGVRVADLTRAFAGPIATMFLAYHGAEVIKVESADLEATRATGTYFAEYNRNKLSCTIDLRHPTGKDVMRRLLAVSDILIDNFSPRVIGQLGFGYEAVRSIRPDIIQVVMPGMGVTGPISSWVSWGTQVQAYSGQAYLWGYAESPIPSRAKIVLPDYIGAAYGALAMVAALEHRDRTGRGQLIELAQLETAASLLGPAILDYTVNGRAWDARGYREEMGAFYAPYGCYPCKGDEAWVVIACETDEEWRALVRVLGGPTWSADPRFSSRAGRREHWEELDHYLGDWTRHFTPFQVFRLLQSAGVPAGVVMTGEDLFRDHHLRARGHLVEVEHAAFGRLTFPGLAAIPSRSSANARTPAPWIGDHNEYVFQGLLGMRPEEVHSLTEEGALR
jgi:crotonobetainyl-CoA:carnitine CoA-transferase CaiB-like acyl-CoA transferase